MAETSSILIIRNDLAELDRMHAFLEDAEQRHAIPADIVFALTLALDELLTNVISYGYDDDAVHEIAVTLDVSDGGIRMRIFDDARPFNPLAAPPPRTDLPVEERQIGGLGIHFVRSMMTSVEYEYSDGKNILSLVKHFASDTNTDASTP